MPYITQDARSKFTDLLNNLPQIDHAGELHYILSEIALKYVSQRGLSYQILNDVAGVSSLLVLELNRRLISDYEQKKAEVNGDTSFGTIRERYNLPNR